MASSSASSNAYNSEDTGSLRLVETSVFPIAFVAHGVPFLATDAARGTELTAWGRVMGRPKSILAISAHWENNPMALGAIVQRPLIYDFEGFPEALYKIVYPAPGAPELFEAVYELLSSRFGTVHDPTRGLDHGVWCPLVHMYRDADIPILQLALPQGASSQELFSLGQALSVISHDNTLLLGSGNVTHNLRQVDLTDNSDIPDWAVRFDLWCERVLHDRDYDALLHYRDCAPDVDTAHPTAEHLAPLIVAAGAACENDFQAKFPITGFEYGSLSRRCVQFD